MAGMAAGRQGGPAACGAGHEAVVVIRISMHGLCMAMPTCGLGSHCRKAMSSHCRCCIGKRPSYAKAQVRSSVLI